MGKRAAAGLVADDVDSVPARVLGLVQRVVGGSEEFDEVACGARRYGHADGNGDAGWHTDGPSTTTSATDLAARIRRRKVLGGLIHEYERAA